MNLLQTVPLHFVMLARARFRVPFLCGQENIWMFNQLQQFWWSGDGDCSKRTARDEAGRLDGPATENEFCNLLRSSVRKIGSVAVFLIIGTMEIRHHVSNFQPIMKCIRLKGRVAAGICGIEILSSSRFLLCSGAWSQDWRLAAILAWNFRPILCLRLIWEGQRAGERNLNIFTQQFNSFVAVL